MSAAPVLQDCSLQFNNVTIGGWSTNAAFSAQGQLVANIGAYGALGSPAISIPAGKALFEPVSNDTCRIMVNGSFVLLTFGAAAGLCTGGTNGFINYEDSIAHSSITGTAALEAITSGQVKKIASNIV
jgi:hypothetical protein